MQTGYADTHPHFQQRLILPETSTQQVQPAQVLGSPHSVHLVTVCMVHMVYMLASVRGTATPHAALTSLAAVVFFLACANFSRISGVQPAASFARVSGLLHIYIKLHNKIVNNSVMAPRSHLPSQVPVKHPQTWGKSQSLNRS